MLPSLRVLRLGWWGRSKVRPTEAAASEQLPAAAEAAEPSPPPPPAPPGGLSPQLLCWLVPAGLLLGLAMLPLQALAAAGFALQEQWHRGTPGLVDPLLLVVVFSGTLTLLALAWGPLAAGRGGGLAAVEGLQQPGLAPAEQERLVAGLRARVQLARLPLLLLTHLAGLAVGIEAPAASLGATTLLALRRRIRSLQALPEPLAAAVGASAGLGAAFRSPLLGVIYGLECLCFQRGFSLVLPTLLLGGVGALVGTDLGEPARVTALLSGALPPILWPWALQLTLLAALVGVGFRRALLLLLPRLDRLLQGQFLAMALLLSLLTTALAHLSGGISLNDGSLELGPALAGRSESPFWAALPRLLSPLLAVAAGAPGGLMHDCMALGAVFVAPLVQRLPADQQAMLVAVGATAVFSAACRTALLAPVFVFVLQNNAQLFPLLLLASAVAAAMGEVLGGDAGPGVPLINRLPLGPEAFAPFRPAEAGR